MYLPYRAEKGDVTMKKARKITRGRKKTALQVLICIGLVLLTVFSVIYQLRSRVEAQSIESFPIEEKSSSKVATEFVLVNTVEITSVDELPDATEISQTNRSEQETLDTQPTADISDVSVVTNLDGDASLSDLVSYSISNPYLAFTQGIAPEFTYICNDSNLIASFQQYLTDYENGNIDIPLLSAYLYEEEYLLAQILDCEAGGTHDMNELLCVGWVVLKRIESNCNDFRSVNSIREVLTQSGQYPATYNAIQGGHSASDICQLAAHILLVLVLAVHLITNIRPLFMLGPMVASVLFVWQVRSKGSEKYGLCTGK